jgi:hypothetical protein
MLFKDNKDLYVAQVSEDFNLQERGFSKTFLLNPKHIDKYSVGITNGEIGFPEDYEFSGKLLIQYYHDNNIVFEQEITKQDVAWDMAGEKRRFKEITLSYFDVPINDKYKDDISIKATVIDPDVKVGEFVKNLKIVIGVSATP